MPMRPTLPEIVLSPEVLDVALAVVGAHVLPREVASALLLDVARALQGEVNRAELAEAERTQAVATMRNLCERLRVLTNTAIIESWFTCPRCGVRGPRSEALEHERGCTLSERPPPRLSLVAPRKDGGDGK